MTDKEIIDAALKAHVSKDPGVINAQERSSAKDEASVQRLKEDLKKAIEKATEDFYKKHLGVRQGIVSPALAAEHATGKQRTWPGAAAEAPSQAPSQGATDEEKP